MKIGFRFKQELLEHPYLLLLTNRERERKVGKKREEKK